MLRRILPLLLVTATACISVESGDTAGVADATADAGGSAAPNDGGLVDAGATTDASTSTDSGDAQAADAGTCAATDWIVPANATESGGGAVKWASNGQARIADGVPATCAMTAIEPTCLSLDLRAFNVVMPPGARITGLELQVRRMATGTGKVVDDKVALMDGTTEVASKVLGLWSNVTEDVTYGGPADTWGNALTQALVTSNLFRVHIRPRYAEGSTGPATASVDGVMLRVHYCD